MSWVKDNVIDPFTGKAQADAAKEAGRLERAAADRTIEKLEPFRQVGVSAINPLQEFVQAGGQDAQTLSQINPLVSFLRGEGFEDIQESAAARGKLGSGGTLRDLSKFNTQLTSTIVPQLQQQRYNQLFNLFSQGGALGTGQGKFDVAGSQGLGSGLQGAADARTQGSANIIKAGMSMFGGGDA